MDAARSLIAEAVAGPCIPRIKIITKKSVMAFMLSPPLKK
jgi:hypothetical protein